MRRPTLVITRTHIGYGSPNRQDTAKAHGEPLGAAELQLVKQTLKWPWPDPFRIPNDALEHWRAAKARGAEGAIAGGAPPPSRPMPVHTRRTPRNSGGVAKATFPPAGSRRCRRSPPRTARWRRAPRLVSC
ncbi:MAG: hypothetical protein U0163_09085 [Gemmatimonadaceae bacterium]